MANKPEVWLRGPLEGIPALLQPVAHALLQAGEEVNELMKDFPEALLWEKPTGLASPGFHLQHMAGVLNRLFTYARGQQLSPHQLAYLAGEGNDYSHNAQTLLRIFDNNVNLAIRQLSETDPQTLTEPRLVGRQHIESTVIGLLVHSAEHTMRHTGQLLVTVLFLLSSS